MSNRARIVLEAVFFGFIAWIVVIIGFMIIILVDDVQPTTEQLFLFGLLSLVQCGGLGAFTAIEKDEKRKHHE